VRGGWKDGLRERRLGLKIREKEGEDGFENSSSERKTRAQGPDERAKKKVGDNELKGGTQWGLAEKRRRESGSPYTGKSKPHQGLTGKKKSFFDPSEATREKLRRRA